MKNKAEPNFRTFVLKLGFRRFLTEISVFFMKKVLHFRKEGFILSVVEQSGDIVELSGGGEAR